MKTQIFTVDTIKNRLSPIFKSHNVSSAVLFGSYAKDCATENSDIDLMVDSRLHGLAFLGLLEDIREALDEREVDLFDVTHIDEGSRVQQEIRTTGVKIYG